MSCRESIRVHCPLDVEKYLAVLKTEFGARDNPEEPGSLVLGEPPQPFYEPKASDPEDEAYVVIVGFNAIPLHPHLMVALINHPELAPATTEVLWTFEQDLVAQGTLERLNREWKSNEGP